MHIFIVYHNLFFFQWKKVSIQNLTVPFLSSSILCFYEIESMQNKDLFKKINFISCLKKRWIIEELGKTVCLEKNDDNKSHYFEFHHYKNSQQFGNEKSTLIFNLVNQKYYWKIFLDGSEWDWREELILAFIHSFIYSRTSLLTPYARKEISNFYFFHRFHDLKCSVINCLGFFSMIDCYIWLRNNSFSIHFDEYFL
jgi:hypothetical protein